MKKLIALASMSAIGLLVVTAQENTVIRVTGGGKAKLAVPDFRGSGDAQKFMGVFNQTLWNDLEDSGYFEMRPKTSMPLFVPQQPSDFQEPPAPGQTPTRKGGQQMTQ